MSVAEDYYKNKQAQVLKGRVVKTPRLWGVSLEACKSEFNCNPTEERKSPGALRYFLSSLESDTRSCVDSSVSWSGLWFVQEGPADSM